MANSANGPCEDQTREIVPSDLLFVHEGLEEDGESWRAALPLAENLLRRVAVFPTHTSASTAIDAHRDILNLRAASAPETPPSQAHTPLSPSPLAPRGSEVTRRLVPRSHR